MKTIHTYTHVVMMFFSTEQIGLYCEKNGELFYDILLVCVFRALFEFSNQFWIFDYFYSLLVLKPSCANKLYYYYRVLFMTCTYVPKVQTWYVP